MKVMYKTKLAALQRAGFTLIELMAVLLIISVLTTILVVNLAGAQESSEIQNTRQLIASLDAVIEDYNSNREGDYPRSSFDEASGVSNDGTNVGNEALVVALFSEGWEAGGGMTNLADELINLDGDRSGKKLTDFGSRELLEIADAWGNPLAYIHRIDYELKPRPYMTFDGEDGSELISMPKAQMNATTGRFYKARSFQLISAGPDGEFGTEDDITNFNI
jgi:prepilin-type N-terminal cleavage/methylation domain-containing protein